MVTIEQDNDRLIAAIYGEIDHHSARMIREELDARITRGAPAHFIMDFSHVSFMDSSGIGLIMGRYKLLNGMGGDLELRGANASVFRMLKLSGMERLAVISNEQE